MFGRCVAAPPEPRSRLHVPRNAFRLGWEPFPLDDRTQLLKAGFDGGDGWVFMPWDVLSL